MTSIRSIMTHADYEGKDWDDLEASVQTQVTEQAVRLLSAVNERLKSRFNNLQGTGVKAIEEREWLVMILTRWMNRRKRSKKINKIAQQSPKKRGKPVCSDCKSDLVCLGCRGLDVIIMI
jgi:hypothetical protein